MGFKMSRRPAGLILIGALLAVMLGLSSCSTVSDMFTSRSKDEVARSYYDRAMGYMDTRKYSQAVDDLRRAITNDPDMYQAYYQLGLAYRALGDETNARDAWTMGVGRAQRGPERLDYPRSRALAEMMAALEGKAPTIPKATPPMTPPPPRPAPSPPPPRAAAPRPSVTHAAAAPSGPYAVLVSSNLKRYNAMNDLNRLKAKGYSTKLTSAKDKSGRTWHRVWVGCCTTLPRAKSLALELKRKGLARDAVAMRLK